MIIDGGAAPVPATPFLTLNGIGKSFGPNRVLRSIDLSVGRGEVIGLLGENGAGKSTLMNIVSGALAADEGTMLLDGNPVRFRSIAEAIGAGIAFVHQELSVVGALSVAENLFLGRTPRTRLGTVDFSAITRAAGSLLTEVGAQSIVPGAPAGSLRAGEQQLVEIAKAAARKPRLLILDEPTSSLTPHEVAGFKDYVRSARSAGTSIIFITHRLEEAMELCDRILVLRNGEIVAQYGHGETNRDRLIFDMTGKTSMFAHVPRAVGARAIALELGGLSDGEAVREATFSVAAGEIVGLFGLVGAGRTELLEVICGARPRASGTMKLLGTEVHFRSPADALRNGVAIVPEGRKTAGILPQHTVRRNASASSLRSLAHGQIMNHRRERDAFSSFQNDLSIRMETDTQPITTLSGGNQQKVIFARALMARPRLLLLDEPTHGVDVGAKADLYEIVRKAADRGLAVVVASSEIPEIIALCDRVGVLSKGRLVNVQAREELSEEILLHYAFSEIEERP